MVSPFLLESKRLLPHLCSHDIGWDEKLSNDLQQRCQEATVKLTTLQTIQVPRCFHPVSFNVEKASLHHFSDASDVGYDYCSYIQMENSNGQVHCSFICGRSRVNPIKLTMSIPRLELMAAVLSAKVVVGYEKRLTS